MVEITAKDTKSGKSAVVEYDIPDDLSGLVEIFGEDVVVARCRAAFVIDIQSIIRSNLKAEKTEDEVATAVAEWKPGVRAAGKSKSEKIMDQFKDLSDDAKKELLASLKKAS